MRLRRHRSIPTKAFAVLVAVMAAPALLPRAADAAPLRYRCMILPGTYQANGVNQHGEVVGRTAPYQEAGQAFYYKAGELTPFGQAGHVTAALAISDGGHIAGVQEVAGIGRAMMADRAGNVTVMDDGGAFWSEAHAINDAIQAVGFVDAADGWNRAAMWDAGAFRDLSGGHDRNSFALAINDLGEIVGWDDVLSARAAYFDPAPSDMGAPGANSEAVSLADAGYVAGSAFDREIWSAWVYDGSEFRTIASGAPWSTRAHAVNDLGQMVGIANGEAFLWGDGTLHPLASLVDEGACTLLEARSISDCGIIVGSAAEGAFMMVPIDAPDETDTDGDGLKDRWERCGLDLDADGVAEFVPPDADPLHADLYVELDHSAAAPVRPEVLGALVDAFAQVPGADLPRPNPDGQPGIALHLLVDDANVTETGDLSVRSAATGPTHFPDVFDPMREDFFGTAAERADPDQEKILDAKHQVYRYGIMVQGLTVTQADGSIDYVSGVSECHGNDFMIATRAFRYPPGFWEEQAGTIMHELGHNLGLQHGGGDDMSFKANYFSVMNYTWQIPHPGMSLDWRLDYSRSASNPTVFETILEEPLGLAGITRDGESVPVYIALNGDPNRVALDWTDVPNSDFNGNGTIDAGTVAVDINHVDPDLPPSPNGRHADYHDWASIVLEFRSSPHFPKGVHVACPGLEGPELSGQLIRRLAELEPGTSASTAVLTTVRRAAAPAGVEAGPQPVEELMRVRFTLPEAGPVRVRVFDANGRLVRTLLDDIRGAGPSEVHWDGRDDRGEPVGAGLYLGRIDDAQGRRTARVMIRQ